MTKEIYIYTPVTQEEVMDDTKIIPLKQCSIKHIL